MTWGNSLGGFGSFSASSNWLADDIPLAVGENVVTVSGTNASGQMASDWLAIVREPNAAIELSKWVSDDGTLDSAVDFLSCTGNQPVTYFLIMNNMGYVALTNVSVTDVDLALSSNVGHLAIGQSVTVAVADVVSASLTNWAFVTGYDTLGQAVTNFDWAEVRLQVPAPHIDITNTTLSLAHSVSTVTVGGVSANLAGHIRWTNALTGLTGQLAAAPDWSFNCALAVGTNRVTVSGTNGLGQTASHAVNFIRSNAPPAAPTLVMLGTNGAVIANGEPVDSVKGTSFPTLRAGISATNRFGIYNPGSGTLDLSSWDITGEGASAFDITNIPSQVLAGVTSHFAMVFQPASAGIFQASLSITNDSSSSPYVMHVFGSAWGLSTNIGPFAGGNSVTITNGALGNGSDITNVLVGGVAATVTAQGANWVTIAMPATGSEGTKDIVVQSESEGDATLTGAYLVNPAGVIEGGPELPDWSRWEEVAGLTVYGQQAGAAGAALNGMVYCAGGFQGPNFAFNNVTCYDGSNWTAVAALPAARAYFGMTPLSNTLVVAGGGNDFFAPQTNVYVFDGANWAEAVGLPQSRMAHAASPLNGAVHVIGGYSGGVRTNVYRFDGSTWTEARGLPAARDYLGAATLEDSIYAVGGYDGSTAKTNVYRYDGIAWSEVAGLPAARYYLGAGTLNGAVYAVGGDSGSASCTNVYRFDGSNWSEAPGLPAPRHALATAVADERLYAMGGLDGGTRCSNVYRYPASMPGLGVTPESGSSTGGFQVVITGMNLGNGADVTNVTLCGINAGDILSQSATQIVLMVGAGGSGLGDVRVYSVSFGETISSNAFTYIDDSGPVMPLIDITNTNESVANSVSNLTIGGVSSNLSGQIRWTNNLTGASGAIEQASPWSFPCGLAVGTNAIGVTGTNAMGAADSDTVTIVRVSAPFIDVTNATATVRYSAVTYEVGGVLAHVGGHLRWTNALTGASGTAAVASPFAIPGIGLAVGANPITVTATNLYGESASDSVTITRGGIGTDLPLVDITTSNQTVDTVASNILIEGVANVHVVGQIAWSNSLGGSGSFAATTNWSFDAVLTIGVNTFTVWGSNLWGEASTDTVAITRSAVVAPYLDITNTNQTVANSVSNLTIGGISSNLSGQIRWTNNLTGASGAIEQASPWSFSCGLAVGTNVIGVTGTNAAGLADSDSVTIVRTAGEDPNAGMVWTNLAAGVSGLAGRVFDIGFTTNGSLLAAGDYSSPAMHIAMWNGSAWSSIGNLSHGSDAVARDQNGNMIVGGAFTTAGGVSANRIAKWNGSVWSALGSGLNGDPIDVLFDGVSNVYAAGSFTTAGGLGAANVARWNGTSWSALGSGVGGVARALAMDGAGHLYVGGDFTNAGGVAVNRIAMWNGATWTNLGAGMNDYVHGLEFDGAGRLYAVGGFTNAGGVAAKYVAMWNGATWTNLGSGLSGAAIGIALDGAGNLYVGGNFTNAGGVAAQRVAMWNGATWTNMGGGMNGWVYALKIDAQGYLYAGGGFTQADGRTANGIARWNKPVPVTPPQVPMLDITNANQTVANSVSNLTIGGVSSNLNGQIRWTNNLTGASGAIEQASPWSFPCGLAVGTNAIGVTGTNAMGAADSDTVTIVRVSAPFVDVTNAASTVRYSAVTYDVGGVLAHVGGHLRWTNAFTGASGTAAVASPFAIPGIGLAVGANPITVTVTNLYGESAFDSVTITRGDIGTDWPVVEVTNESTTVTYDMASWVVGGTANIHVKGQLTWHNSLGGSGSFAAATNWSFVASLAVGTNVLTVSGTNAVGESDQDSVTVVRPPPPNLPPYWTSVPVTNGTVGKRYVYRLRAVDPESAPLSFSCTNLPAWLELTVGSGEVYGTNIITTVAGDGRATFAGDGGPATNAALRWPHGVAVDAQGNLYIADHENHRVRKVSASGLIATIAGNGSAGYNGDGIAATNASLYYPSGIDVDASGYVYVADHYNHRIRRIAPDGTIATVAGRGVSGFSGDGGPATNASLSYVMDVDVGPDGALYLADVQTHRIRKVDAAGIITTVAGGGSGGDGSPATNAALNTPIGVEVGPDGSLYIADHWGQRVRKVDPDGIITLLAGTGSRGYNGDNRPASGAMLNYPYAVALDAEGNVYIADDENNRIRKIDTNGVITTVAGRGVFGFGGDGGAATNARVAYPTDVAFDADGNLYICDSGSHRIRKIAGESGGWMLRGTPGPGDAGTFPIVLDVSDGVNTVPQAFVIQVGELRTPTNLNAVGLGPASIELTWTDNNTDETGYVIERRASSNDMWAAILSAAAGTGHFVDGGLASGRTYFYRIFAINPDGPSQPSAPVSATTLSVPSAPDGLTASADATNRITLRWADTSGNEAGFELQRKTGAAGTWVAVAWPAMNSAVHSDTGLEANTLYYYRLRATNAAGASAFTREASASTPPVQDDPDCGYVLGVTATNLTVDAAALAWPATVNDGALIGGSLGVIQTSPRGLGAVQRAAIGFRSLDGRVAGAPLELPLLYGVPGCPGTEWTALELPEDLRAPTGEGDYRLWIESYLTPFDPVAVFRAQVRTNQDNLARVIGPVTVQARPAEQVDVRLLAAFGVPGQPVAVPVLLTSTGGVNALSFSVSYDAAIVARPSVRAGSDAAGIWSVANTNTSGRVGVLLQMPGDESLGSGTKGIAELVFMPVTNGVSALGLVDTPVVRSVAFVDPDVAPSVTWSGADVTIRVPGYEGDLAPRPGGDLAVTEADAARMRLIVAGFDSPSGSNEYQKADCSPRGTRGNGRIDVADLRQVERYRLGTDPLQTVGGPGASTNGLLTRTFGFNALGNEPPMVVPYGESDRVMYLSDTTVSRGANVWLPVYIAAQGNESTLGFSLAFDPDVLSYLDMRAVGAATNAVLVPSLSNLNDGEIGFALAMPGSGVWPVGNAALIEVAFAAAVGSGTTTTLVSFADRPVMRSCADIDASALPSTYTGATITVQAVTDPGAPNAPEDLVAEAASTNQINLSWTDAAFDETGFRVLRRTDESTWSEVASLAADTESYADVGLASATAYRYRVAAVNAQGENLSDEAEVSTWSAVTAWRLAKFGTIVNMGDTADDGDWDYDGAPNLVEYALGTDPTNEFSGTTPWTVQIRNGVTIDASRFATVWYDIQPGAAEGVNITIQYTDNLLSSWTNTMAPVDTVITNGAQRVRVRAREPLDGTRHQSLRMSIEAPAEP